MDPNWIASTYGERLRRSVADPAAEIGTGKPMDVTTAGFLTGSLGQLYAAPAASAVQVYQAASMWREDEENTARAKRWLEELKPKPATEGTLAQMIYSIGTIAPQAIAGYVGGSAVFGGLPFTGAAGAAGFSGAVQGTIAYDELRQKLDKETALKASLIIGGITGIGAAVPASLAGRGLSTDLIYTIAANTGLGMVERAGVSSTLARAGYSQLSKQYEAFDAEAMTADTILGLAFMGLSRRHYQAYGGLAELGREFEKRVEDVTPPTSFAAPHEIQMSAPSIRAAIQADYMTTGKVLTMLGLPVDGKSHMVGLQILGDTMEQIFLKGKRPGEIETAMFPVMEVAVHPDGSFVKPPQLLRAEAQTDAAIARGRSEVEKPEVIKPKPKEDYTPEQKRTLEALKSQTGYAEVGGRLLRDEATGDVTGRTSWVPKMEWWPDRPKGLTEKQAIAAMDKAAKGEPLTKREKRLVDYMLEMEAKTADPTSRYAEFVPTPAELLDAGIKVGDEQSAADIARIAMAGEKMGEAWLERKAIQHGDDYRNFMLDIMEANGERIIPETVGSREAGIATETADAARKYGAETGEKYVDGKTQDEILAASILGDNPDAVTINDKGEQVSLSDELKSINQEMKMIETENAAIREYLMCLRGL